MREKREKGAETRLSEESLFLKRDSPKNRFSSNAILAPSNAILAQNSDAILAQQSTKLVCNSEWFFVLDSRLQVLWFRIGVSNSLREHPFLPFPQQLSFSL
ncbi:unnamed protein product [Lathyrus oleraceus]